MLRPTPWHKPSLKLYCGGAARRDFSTFAFLEFYIRLLDTDAPPNSSATFSLTNWQAESAVLPLAEFVDGGVIDATWRRARIPISRLQTSGWRLHDVEFLRWGVDPGRTAMLVDDIRLRRPIDEPPLAAQVISDRFVRIPIAEPLSLSSVRAATYLISTKDSPTFRPLDVGVQWHVSGFSGTKQGNSNAPNIGGFITLQLPSVLRANVGYRLSVSGLRDRTGATIEAVEYDVQYDPLATSPLIKVNQVGYLTAGPKVGFVGGYAGDLGAGTWALDPSGGVWRTDEWADWTRVDVSALGGRVPRGIFVSGRFDVWLAGDAGLIARYDRDGWRVVASGTNEDLFGITVAPNGAVWAVGRNGTILARPAPTASDGKRSPHDRWRSQRSGTTVDLHSVFARDAHEVLAVGAGGVLLNWKGAKWRMQRSRTRATFLAVDGLGAKNTWAVGEQGTVFEWRYGQWREHASPTRSTLRRILPMADGVVSIVGDDIALQRLAFDTPLRIASRGAAAAPVNPLAQPTMVLPNGLPVHASSTNAGGAIALDAVGVEVQIVDVASGRPVTSAPLVLAHRYWPVAGEEVYRFDFSRLTAPGVYQAQVQSIGVSDPFRIGPDVFDQTARTVGRALHHQRCGTALTHTLHTHDICHLDPAKLHPSATNTALPPAPDAPRVRSVVGGWHDAGDYNRYVPTGVSALWYLLTAFELRPEGVAAADDWMIPQSGNGIPDLLDEAIWELDWLVALQDRDGGIAHKVTTKCWHHGMPQDGSQMQFISARTTHDTAAGAAVLAAASRVLSSLDPARSRQYLSSAKRAWDFVSKFPGPVPPAGYTNPPDICTGQYKDPDGDSDERAWAAAELFRTTGRHVYHQAFLQHWAQRPALWGWNPWRHRQRNASWAYLNTQHEAVDKMLHDRIREALTTEADHITSRTKSSPYLSGFRADVLAQIGWGSFAQSTQYTFTLLLASAALGRDDYRAAAALNANAQLGANPLGRTFITGVGARPPLDPLHQPSMHDSHDPPVPGLTVFGPMTAMSNANPFSAAVQSPDNTYPSWRSEHGAFPVLRRYVDSNELVGYNEFTVLEIARTFAALHFLEAMSR